MTQMGGGRPFSGLSHGCSRGLYAEQGGGVGRTIVVGGMSKRRQRGVPEMTQQTTHWLFRLVDRSQLVKTCSLSRFLASSNISEASSRDPFVFSTLRQPRCIEWMALVDLMVTL